MEHLYRAARHLAEQGRGPDTHLMHVTGNEIGALGRLHPSGKLPRNPSTGLPEAGFFEDILPSLVGIGLNFIPGVGPMLSAAASGLTSAAVTGDLGKGIMSGLLSYGAGNILNAGAEAAVKPGLDAAASSTAAANIAKDAASSIAPQTASQAVSGMNFGDKLSNFATGVTESPGQFASSLTSNATKTLIPFGIGAAGTFGAQEPMQVPKEPTSAELQRRYPEQAPTPRTLFAAPEGYDPGVDEPFDYFRFASGGEVDSYATGGGISGLYAKGGIADPNPVAATKANIVAEAKMAILDHHPKAKDALRRFAETFGEDALKDLTNSLSSMGGRIRGAGGGLDDLIPGTIEGRKEVRLADGEFVVPADVVSHLGDGSSDHGVRKLTEMMDRIRKEKTGTTKQAGHINDKKVMPA
jgi:hypothetical protein